MQRFVALDLELTPFSADQQRIIEIAAVRFFGARAVESFSTLVDPGCDVTPRVEALTGISRRAVDGAPPLDQVIPDLMAFLGQDPLVGQSIGLDIQCLAFHGVPIGNRVYDTFELATLLLPGLPAYDLGTIARSLGVELEQEHRALCDALVAGRVFLALVERASRLDLDVITQVNALAAQLPSWPFTELFSEIGRVRLKSHFTVGDHPLAAARRSVAAAPRTPLRPAAQPVVVEGEELRALLAPGGAVAAALPGYEEREEQLRMMHAVASALNDGAHLLVEAGTGTGKSLAYLLPAIYHAVRSGHPVVVSTNTINLQDQLYHKDIPLLQSCLAFAFRAALLKGRANYLCLRRWMVLSRSPNLSRPEVLLLIKVLIWLSATESGDRSELNLSDLESLLWAKISAQAESCALGKCPSFRRGSCFVTRARRNAESAHVIVVNHALLLSDLATSGGILPEYSQVILDEAHHLEQEATEQLGFTLSWGDLSTFLAGLHQVGSLRKPVGFLPDLLGALRPRQIPQETAARIRTLVSSIEAAVGRSQTEGMAFFETLNCFLHDHTDEKSLAGARVRITRSIRTQPGWSETEVRWGELSGNLRSLQQLLLRLVEQIELLDDTQLPSRDGALAELSGYDSFLERVRARGEEIISAPNTNGIYWISSAAGLESPAIRSAPLHVGEALNNALFSSKRSVILTSATLTAEGSFDYIRERLGLENARELIVGSPFDYKRSTMLFVVRDIPEPSRPTYQRAIESTLVDLVLALEGRTLVLFTSHAQLRVTNSAIRQRLEQQGILVLAHGMDGSRRRLLQAFASSPKALLMGTSSFWEGIDVVGEALSCLVIVKLPFAVPTDPIFAARSEGFEEPFRQYSVPQTILKFRQGFGRLIRTRSDRGVVVILDSRVGSKFYGPSFIHSLPPCTLRIGSAQHVAETARAWLSRAPELLAEETPALAN